MHLGKWIKTRELFPSSLIPVQGGGWAEHILPAERIRRDPPWSGHPPITELSQSHPHSDWWFRHTNSSSGHIFGMWEETGISRERNPTQTWGDIHTQYRLWVAQLVIGPPPPRNQHYNIKTLNKMTLFEDLLFKDHLNGIHSSVYWPRSNRPCKKERKKMLC